MRIEIRVGRVGLRRWHLRLADRLRSGPIGADVRVALVPGGGEALPAQVGALLQLEHLIRRRGRAALFDPLPAGAAAAGPAEGAPDVVIDCSGGPPEAARGDAPARLRPLFGGMGSEGALIAGLLRGGMPDIAVEDVGTGAIAASGRPGGGDAGLLGGLDAVLSRTVLLIERALREREAGTPAPPKPEAAPDPRPAEAERGAVAWAMRNMARDCARTIYHLCVRAPHWHIGWRIHDGPGVMERGNLDGPGWTVLDGGPQRFFADPFPVTWEGRTVVFFEEYDYRVGRGTIAGVAFDGDGPAGRPFPVLAEPFHLSYPFVMESEGALYMVPEASLTGAVPLYRCVEFPARWERVGSLLEGIEASDCTIFRHDGLLWMTSSTRDGLGGYSDTLSIHHAERLTDRWTEHAVRPALIDAGLARPGGNVVRGPGGRLCRPIQDCRAGYGLGLVLADIDRLDHDHFEQTVRATIVPGARWAGRRLHTLNRAGRLEVIDGATTLSRLPLPLRG